ncbi:energy transducer TonB [Sphingobium sp. EM0848]|uniref:energy transducer TonB n=1 Tax=Sphingobium sp. EM0848 TaxID=2743473 RepID=UPI00159CADDA|nr:energy transducer TonB [Sphingobium sp. EM0848]
MDKIASAISALAVTGMIGFALIAGLRDAPMLRTLADTSPLALFNLKPPVKEKPEPAKPVKQPAAEHQGGGRAAPAPHQADLKRPAAIIAPVPAITVPSPAVPTVASSVGTGVDGGGSGGAGNGRGSGGSGAGAGGPAGEDAAFSPARQTIGRFRNSDFPETARGAGRLKIGVRYVIEPSGRVDKCEIIEGSGYAEVDAMTCRIIEERYRFRPARDPEGYPVAEVREEDYRWRPQ